MIRTREQTYALYDKRRLSVMVAAATQQELSTVVDYICI